tara:strand:+ start:3026 stop:3280 length:255 start_codon:yes stop_codon:yes gene_type:complete
MSEKIIKLKETELKSLIEKLMNEEDTTQVQTDDQQEAINDMIDGMDEMMKDLEQMSMEMDSTDYEALKAKFVELIEMLKTVRPT